MTMRFMDSFDHYATADITEKWSSINATPVIAASVGRRSTAAMEFNSNTDRVSKQIDAQSTWTVGMAISIATQPGTGGDIIYFGDSGADQCGVFLNADKTLSFRRGTTVLGTSTFALPTGGYSYLECKVVIDNTAGTFEIRVDGSNKLSATGQDTQATANATANEIFIHGRTAINTGPGTGLIRIDDLFINDGAGSVNNGFLGDSRVDSYAPNGNGNSSQHTGSDGNSVDNYLLVDEAAPNDDTDYVESTTVGNKDTYAFTDMTHTPATIHGVQLCMAAKKDDAGAKSIAGVTRSGGTDFDGATVAISTSYQYVLQMRETDPNTSAAWTKTNLNAAEFGMKVAA